MVGCRWGGWGRWGGRERVSGEGGSGWVSGEGGSGWLGKWEGGKERVVG